MNEEQQKWLKVALVTGTLICITVGFLLGYLVYSSDGCIQDPLTYGLEKMNEINEDYFMCSCYGMEADFHFSTQTMEDGRPKSAYW